MPSISVHARTLPELGLQALQHAIQTNKWPVQVSFFSRFRQTTQLFATFTTCRTTHRLPLQPVPFHPHTHRATLALPPGIHQYRVVRAHSVIASGTLHVLPLQLPSTLPPSTPSNPHRPFAQPLRDNAVAFTFSEHVPRMAAVRLEIRSSHPRSLPMLKRGHHTFTKKLPLPPGRHRYRFRVLFQPPLRRLTHVPLTRLGWNFSDSFRWGVATQWMTVHVAPHPPATSSNLPVPTDHRTDKAADHTTHSTPLTATTAPPRHQLETLQSATSCDHDASSDTSDALLCIDTTLDGYSSEVSTSEVSETLDDVHHFAILSSTSNEATTSSSHSVPQSLSNYPFPTQRSPRPSDSASSSYSSRLEACVHEHSSSTSSQTRDLPAACAALNKGGVESDSGESLLDALQTTPDVSDVISFAEISSPRRNYTQRDTGKSPQSSYDVWDFAAKKAENMEKFETQSWTKGIAFISLKAMLKGAMMAAADSMMSRTKAKPD